MYCCGRRHKDKQRAIYKALSTEELEARKIELDEELMCEIATSTVYWGSTGGLIAAGAITATLPALLPAIGASSVSGSVSAAKIASIERKLSCINTILDSRLEKSGFNYHKCD